MPRSTLRLVLLVISTVLAALLVVPAAQAATDAQPPVTQDDALTIDAGDVRVADVLANDSDPQGDDLAVCRYTVPDGSPLSVAISGDGIAVSSAITAAGTYTLTYYACNYTYLTPATLTVTIRKVPAVTCEKVAGRPGHVRFVNPGDQAVAVTYTVPSGDGPEGKVTVAPYTRKVVTVTRSAIVFVAVRRSGAIVGYGTVRGIPLPRHRAATGA